MERKLVNIDLQRHRRCRISSINDTDDRLRSARFVEHSTGRPGLRHGIKVIDMEGQQRPPQLTTGTYKFVSSQSKLRHLHPSLSIFIYLHPWVPESPRSDSVVLAARWLSTTESMLISSCSLPCQTVNATLAEGIWRPSQESSISGLSLYAPRHPCSIARTPHSPSDPFRSTTCASTFCGESSGFGSRHGD